jgi:DegV family protein with EDD domain
MARPTVLLLDPQADRLRELSHHLTAGGYEVVPLADAAKGRRFAQGLGAVLTVATSEALAGLPDAAELMAELASAQNGSDRALVVLGRRAEEEESLPEAASFLVTAGLGAEEVARRLRLVLLGREVGLEPDATLTSLIGDLSHAPLIDLLRGFATAGLSGRVDLRGGTLLLDRGQVVAAAAGPAQGIKAFCRLGRLHEGPVRLVPDQTLGEAADTPREIREDLGTLILAAIEDSLGDLPDPRSRLEIDLKPAFFTTTFTAVQQQILGLAQRGATVQQVLDEVPARDGEIAQEILRLTETGVLVRKEAEAQVRIVTDSTSDLPPDLARSHGITVVPLTVAFGQEVFRDRVDLQPGQFYQMLARRKEHPASSPPPIDDFLPRYRDLLDRGNDVVSLHLSARLSKTFESAGAAATAELARTGGQRRCAVLDTGQVSLGLGLLALFAARMAARNEPADRIIRRIREMAPRVHTLFAVDTLEYLARGGRIGRAKALLGGLLRIKPILGVVDGEVAPVGQARGGRNVQPRLLELLLERIDPKRPLIVAVAHADVPAWADRLEKLLREKLQIAELLQTEVGPVVGANVGPGVVGLAAFQPAEGEIV